MSLKQRLILHEGMQVKPYTDTKGKLTIGVGRNLEDVGISQDEALHLLDNDIARARADADTFQFFGNLDPVRQDVLVELVFNMGLEKIHEFKKMLAAMAKGDFHIASAEMLNSEWASQVGMRAVNLAKIMLSGDDQ